MHVELSLTEKQVKRLMAFVRQVLQVPCAQRTVVRGDISAQRMFTDLRHEMFLRLVEEGESWVTMDFWEASDDMFVLYGRADRRVHIFLADHPPREMHVGLLQVLGYLLQHYGPRIVAAADKRMGPEYLEGAIDGICVLLRNASDTVVQV